MPQTLASLCQTVLGASPASAARLHGGNLSDVTRLTLTDGRIVVAKSGPMVMREARMLTALHEAGAPVPRVLAAEENWLVLQHLTEARPTPASWARFGQDLRALHDTAGPGYGWPEDYAFGAVSLPNGAAEDRPAFWPQFWPDFWATRRLLPHTPHLPAPLATRIEALCRRLPDLLPAQPAPGLLHGDLWGGNLLPTAARIHLIDPACYYGHGEVDLAMLHLFAAPGPRFAEGYGPLAPGWETRRAVYSLFPALVHIRLFGAGYHAMAQRFLTRAGF